jgi:hypothetical protein
MFEQHTQTSLHSVRGYPKQGAKVIVFFIPAKTCAIFLQKIRCIRKLITFAKNFWNYPFQICK